MAFKSLRFKAIDNEQVYLHPNCFYLHYQRDKGLFAEWGKYDSKREQTWSAVVHWKELGLDVLLVTNLPGLTSDEPAVTSWNVSANIRDVPLLKSHLQKAVRRSNVRLSVLTAAALLEVSPTEALRRILVIALEDALPVDGFEEVMWLCAAVSKGLVMTNVTLSLVLGFVRRLAMCPYYEQFDVREPLRKGRSSVKSMRLARLKKGKGFNLCYSLAFRKSFGGMDGDMAMLLAAVFTWKERFHTQSRFLDMLPMKEAAPEAFVSLPKGELCRTDMLLAAADFHCFPPIVNELQMTHDTLEVQDIKDAIWHCSSSLTDKENIGPDLGQRNFSHPRFKKTWETIRKLFYTIAKRNTEKKCL